MVAVRQPGVGRDRPREPVRVFGEQAQTDEATPVLTEQGHVLQVQHAEQRAAHPLDVPGVRVVTDLTWLVRTPETDEVGSDDTAARACEHPDHLAVEERPRRLAVQADDHGPVRRTVGHVGHPQRARAVAALDLDVARFEVEVGQVGKP